VRREGARLRDSARRASLTIAVTVTAAAGATSLGCAHAPRLRAGGPAHAHCASLDSAACDHASALILAASTYVDEAHDYVLRSAAIAPQSALARTNEGWLSLSLACARPRAPTPKLDPRVTDYAFVGVVVDTTLVSADADIGPLLAHGSGPHDVKLVALAFVRDLDPPSFEPSAALVERPSGGCSCGEASHFVGATKYGASLSYGIRPRPIARDTHVRALDFVRAAFADPHVAVTEARVGKMAIEGLGPLLSPSRAPGASAPPTFRITDAVPVAYAASPVGELCDFPAPEVSPSPLDFGVAPYGTEARRTVHVVNRAPIDLRAILGASTFVLPAHGAIDLPLRWTPDGDAPGCETQTRDESIPFLRLGGSTPRTARVLETIRTGRPSVEQTERVGPAAPDPRATRDWTCPRDFVRSSCRVANASGGDAVAEPRGKDACHFACRSAVPGGGPAACRFDATMSCALFCAP
jgi:hypothetical protein